MTEDDAHVVALLHYLSYTVFRTAWEIWVAIQEKSIVDLSVDTEGLTIDGITAVMCFHRERGTVEEKEEQFDHQKLPTWRLISERATLPGWESQFAVLSQGAFSQAC